MTTVISVTNLAKAFGSVAALRDVTFDVREGEIFAVVGPNGAGKTTTVECIAGSSRPDQGTVRVLGVDPAAERAFVRERVGYQLQSTALPPMMRVGEAVELFTSFYRVHADATELLDQVGLRAERARPFSKLSGGQRQRLSVALALVGMPRVAVFDELTTGLDPQGRRDVWALIEQIRDRGTTILLVTHFMDEVERLSDRLAVIDSGRIRFVGTTGDLMKAMTGVGSSVPSLEDAYLQLLETADAELRGGG